MFGKYGERMMVGIMIKEPNRAHRESLCERNKVAAFIVIGSIWPVACLHFFSPKLGFCLNYKCPTHTQCGKLIMKERMNNVAASCLSLYFIEKCLCFF